jgi:hypothetical protein
MTFIKNPYIIQFPKFGEIDFGYISVAEKDNLPFIPKRVYWTYLTPNNVSRGKHAHHELEQILISLSGELTIEFETYDGIKTEFTLNSPDKGVFIPKKSWHTMRYSVPSVQICLASMEYDESDYIRNYDDFLNLRKL